MPLLDNLVAYWKLNGNSNDAKGSYNGTDQGITYSLANGKINQGAGFNSSVPSKITINNNTVFNPSSNITLNLWINPTTFPLNFLGIIDKYIGSTSGYFIDIQNSTNKNVRFSIYTTSDKQVLSTTALVAGTWYMITGTYDGSNLKIYVNGILENTTAVTGNITSNTHNLILGGDGVSTNYFNGKIDEFGFWSKALTQTEITQLYNGSLGLTYPFGSGNFFRFM